MVCAVSLVPTPAITLARSPTASRTARSSSVLLGVGGGRRLAGGAVDDQAVVAVVDQVGGQALGALEVERRRRERGDHRGEDPAERGALVMRPTVSPSPAPAVATPRRPASGAAVLGFRGCGSTSTSSPRPGPGRRPRATAPARAPQRVRLPDAVRPGRGLPGGDDQAAAHALGHRRAAVVPARRHQRRAGCRSAASRSGTSGPTRTATSGRSTATSGGPGRPRTGARWTRSPKVIESIRTNPD